MRLNGGSIPYQNIHTTTTYIPEHTYQNIRATIYVPQHRYHNTMYHNIRMYIPQHTYHNIRVHTSTYIPEHTFHNTHARTYNPQHTYHDIHASTYIPEHTFHNTHARTYNPQQHTYQNTHTRTYIDTFNCFSIMLFYSQHHLTVIQSIAIYNVTGKGNAEDALHAACIYFQKGQCNNVQT